MSDSDCGTYRVTPVLWASHKHCPQRWPKKNGDLHWRCKEPVAYFMERDDGMGGAVCQKHLDYLKVGCEEAAA